MKKPVIHEVQRYLIHNYPDSTGAQFAKFELKRFHFLRKCNREIERILNKIANSNLV